MKGSIWKNKVGLIMQISSLGKGWVSVNSSLPGTASPFQSQSRQTWGGRELVWHQLGFNYFSLKIILMPKWQVLRCLTLHPFNTMDFQVPG